MKLVYFFLIILLHLQSLSCGLMLNKKDNSKSTIVQRSYYHGKLNYDYIKLSEIEETGLPSYSKLEIFRSDSLIYSFKREGYEFIGYNDNIFEEFILSDFYYYLVRLSDRPLPDKFFVIISNEDSTFNLGITNNTTANIIGDIDSDGYIEVGGQYDYNNFKYNIFEIRKNFPIDTALTNFFNKIRSQNTQ
jgi:hypothetical protein